jgi:hypothetical protein
MIASLTAQFATPIRTWTKLILMMDDYQDSNNEYEPTEYEGVLNQHHNAN